MPSINFSSFSSPFHTHTHTHTRCLVLVSLQVWRQVEKAECTDTIVHRCNNNISNGRERFRIVDIERRGAAHVATAVDPYELRESERQMVSIYAQVQEYEVIYHGQALAVMLVVVAAALKVIAMLAIAVLVHALVPQPSLGRRPDVQVQTVLGHVGIRIPHLLAREAREVLVALLYARRR
jgi:hypothetical protein